MKVIMRRILLCCAVGVIIVFFVKHFDAKEYTIDNEQEFVDRVCEMSDVPALSVAVWDGENEVFLNYTNSSDTIDENTLYELASTTKAFTGLAILQLQENGLLAFDTPVRQYIPEFHPTYKGVEAQISIEQLLNHTSGIPSYALDLIPEESYHEGGLSQSLAGLYNVALAYEPGAKHSYSTVNYDLLALVLERITGMGYEDYVKAYVLDEIGMTDSFFRTDAVQANVTQGYKQSFLFFSCPYNAPVYYGNTAAGYLISDTRDLMKWLKNVKVLFDFEHFPIDAENNYYAGWNIYNDYVSHSGSNPNYASQVYIDRDEPLGVFALAAKNSSSATTVADGLFRMHKGETVRIGLHMDFFEVLDVIFALTPLLFIYFVLWIPVNTKTKALVQLVAGSIAIIAFIVFPFVSPISYRYCFVWFPVSLVFFVGATLLVAVYMIARSMVYLKIDSI